MRCHDSTTTKSATQFFAVALIVLLTCASTQVSALTVTEFPVLTPSSTPQGITVGSDGNLWFTEESGPCLLYTSPSPRD